MAAMRLWMRLRRSCQAMAFLAAGGLALGMPTTNAVAVAPHLYATPACTGRLPYEADLHIANFPLNDRIRILAGYYRSGGRLAVLDYPITITTRPNGTADSAGATFFDTEPGRVGELFYHDRDGNDHYTNGDDVVANLILTLDQTMYRGRSPAEVVAFRRG